jgi:hypothetical protein
MATAPPLLPIEEYLRTSYHPDADYVDGEIEERNLGEFEHARLQLLIGAFFAAREKDWHIRGVVEQRIRITSSRVRVCDLALLRADLSIQSVAQHSRSEPKACRKPTRKTSQSPTRPSASTSPKPSPQLTRT